MKPKGRLGGVHVEQAHALWYQVIAKKSPPGTLPAPTWPTWLETDPPETTVDHPSHQTHPKPTPTDCLPRLGVGTVPFMASEAGAAQWAKPNLGFSVHHSDEIQQIKPVLLRARDARFPSRNLFHFM